MVDFGSQLYLVYLRRHLIYLELALQEFKALLENFGVPLCDIGTASLRLIWRWDHTYGEDYQEIFFARSYLNAP